LNAIMVRGAHLMGRKADQAFDYTRCADARQNQALAMHLFVREEILLIMPHNLGAAAELLRPTRIDRLKISAHAFAHQKNRGDDGDRDAAGNERVLDGSRSVLIGKEPIHKSAHVKSSQDPGRAQAVFRHGSRVGRT
jgi:hypothetical protein